MSPSSILVMNVLTMATQRIARKRHLSAAGTGTPADLAWFPQVSMVRQVRATWSATNPAAIAIMEPTWISRARDQIIFLIHTNVVSSHKDADQLRRWPVASPSMLRHLLVYRFGIPDAFQTEPCSLCMQSTPSSSSLYAFRSASHTALRTALR